MAGVMIQTRDLILRTMVESRKTIEADADDYIVWLNRGWRLWGASARSPSDRRMFAAFGLSMVRWHRASMFFWKK